MLWHWWLGGRKDIQPVINRVVRCWHGCLSGVRCRLAYGPTDATATLVSSFSKILIGLPFWYQLTRVVPEKGPLNGCVCVCVCVCVCWFTFPALAHPGSPGQRAMHACFCASGLPEILWVKLHSPKQNTHTHTHTHTSLTALCPGIPGWARTRKVKTIWTLLKQETVSGSGISWAICKSAPRSRQITMPAPHRSVFLQVGCPSCRPTNSVKALKAFPKTEYLRIIKAGFQHDVQDGSGNSGTRMLYVNNWLSCGLIWVNTPVKV